MSGKLFLLTVVCISFVQVLGNEELENNILNAIKKARDILYVPYWETTYFDSSVKTIMNRDITRTAESLKKADAQFRDIQNFLYSLARNVESQTSDQSVYPCIREVRNKSLLKATEVTVALKIGLLEESNSFITLGGTFKSDSMTLERLSDYEYNKVENRIRNCTKNWDVEEALRNYEHLYAVVMKSLNEAEKQFYPFLSTHNAKVEQHHNEYNKEVKNLKTDSVNQMKKCLSPKAAILENSTFLKLINKY